MRGGGKRGERKRERRRKKFRNKEGKSEENEGSIKLFTFCYSGRLWGPPAAVIKKGRPKPAREVAS